RSPAIRIGRRRRRSTQTPAGSVKRRKGRNSTVPSTATSNADASRTSTAAKGIASWETCEPNWLTVSADQSFRKSAWRQSPPFGQRLRTDASRGDRRLGLEQREGERVRLPLGDLCFAEVDDEAAETLPEAAHVLRQELGVQERGLVLLVSGGHHLVGRLAEHQRRERSSRELLRERLVALQDEQLRDAAVVLLRERAHLSR